MARRDQYNVAVHVEEFHQQAKVHPGLALRTLLYRLIMLQRHITLREIAQHLNLSIEAVSLQLREGIRGTANPGLEFSMDEVDTRERSPWLDRLDQAITEISDARGGVQVDPTTAVRFREAMRRHELGLPQSEEGEPARIIRRRGSHRVATGPRDNWNGSNDNAVRVVE